MPDNPEKIVVLDGHTLTGADPGQTAPPGDQVLSGTKLAPADPEENAPPGEPTWVRIADMGELTVHPRTPEDQVVQRIGDASIALTNKTPITTDTLEAAPNLRYVGVLATGVNVVDLAAADRAGVTVTNAPGYSSDSVAQHVFALLLELALSAGRHDAAVHDGAWSGGEDFSFTLAPTVELTGRTLGIVGVGDIGRRVARIGAAMGMNIAAAHQSSMDRVRVPGVQIDWLNHEDLFAAADVVTLHCPLNDQTRGLVNQRRLATMKPHAYLINTGRGGLVEERALAQALRESELAGAGLDVLDQEPPPPDHPLLQAPRCIITPHMAWATQASRRRLMEIAADNLQAFLDGQPRNVVRG